jgi:hypothetical protein
MTSSSLRSARQPIPSDLSESLDIRFLVAGRLTPTAIPLRRDRAELATVIGDLMEPGAEGASESDHERNPR